MGAYALFHFHRLVETLPPVQAHPVHLVHMSLIGEVLGGVIGGTVYPKLDLPEGVTLMTGWGRVPLAGLFALVATVTALQTIGVPIGTQLFKEVIK